MQEITTESPRYKIDFLKYRYFWLFVSIAYLVIGGVVYVMKGGFHYHIDFTGGTELRISFEQTMDVGKIRDVMGTKGFKNAIIQRVGNTDKEFLIRIASLSGEAEKQMKDLLNEGFINNKAHIDYLQSVGAEVGKDTTKNAVMAILLSLLVLLLYIALRFEFRFGLGAVASLVHDVLAVLVFLMLVDVPISLDVLAAVLAILGYSLHDTIVIFSRIRQNFKKLHGISDYDIANLSINQTLNRTLLTSFATLLSVAAILFLGGESLHDLALVMFLGIIVGTYSSIYIASPVMLALKGRKRE